MKTKSPLFRFNRLLIAALALLAAPQVHAQTNIWTNPITGTSPGTNNPYTTGDSVASNITVSGIGRGSGVTGATGNDRYVANSWNTASIDLTAYFTFTLNPSSGYEIDFGSFLWSFQRSAAGPTNMVLRSSIDSFAADIWSTNTTSTSALSVSNSLSGASFQNITNSIEFRIYGWGTTNSGGTFSVNDFRFTGNVNQLITGALNWAGGSGNWDAGFGGTVTNGSALSFSGAGGIATNNLSSPLIASMTFSNGAGSYTVAGNAFTISNGIVNSSASLQTFSNDITLGAAQSFSATAGALTFAGNIDNGGNVLTVGGASNTIVAGIISGAAGLTKSGLGTLTLSNANTFTGTITANGGVISVDNDAELGNSANDITFGGGTLQTTASIDMGSGRDLSGTGVTLDIANGTTLTNGGTVSLTTVTLANSGTFEISGATKSIAGLVFSTASVLTNTGAAATLGGNVTNNNASGTVVMAGDYSLSGSRTFSIGNGSADVDMRLTGDFTAASAFNYLAKQGTGRLEIAGDNSGFIGGVQLGSAGSVAAGQLLVADRNAFGQAAFRFNSGTLEASAALTGASAITNAYTIGGRDANAAILGGANAIELSGAGGWFQVNNATAHLAVNNQSILSGVLGTVTETGVSILFSGTGTLTLAGASANLFTNAVTVSNGLSLVLDKDGALGTSASGTTVQSGAELVIDGIDYATAEGLTISGTGKGGAGALRANGTSIYAGAVASSGGATIGVDAGGTLLLSGAVTGAGVTKAGSGDLTISNASSSFGTLTTGSGTTAIAASATATGLAGSGALNFAGGTFTLNNATAQTFSGVISGGGAFVKTGAGTATLSGNSGSFTGATTVTNGTLVVNGNLSGSAVSVGHASLAEGSVLMGTGSVGATTINTNGVIAPGNSVGILSVSNTLTWNGGGSYLWEINGTNGPAGTTWDLITVDTTSAGDGLGTLNLPGSGQFTINGEAIDAFVFDGDQDYLGNFFLIAEAATINGSPGNLAFIGSGLGLGTWSFATNATGLYLNYEAPEGVITFTPTGVVTQSESAATPAGDYSTITGGFAVIIDGAGTLVMTNAANDYTGTTSVLGGTLRADVNAPNSAAGAFGNSITAVQVGDTSGSDSATLDIGVDGVTIGRAIEVVAGSSGTKTVGTSLSSGTATYSGAVVLGTTSQLTSGGTANAVFSGQISGTGGITKVGDGTVTLSGSGANSFGGAATVSAGTLLLNKTGVEAVTTSITVNGGTLMLGAANQIANTATVTLGGGSFDLGGNNEQITTLQLNNGTLAGSGGTLTAATYNLAGGTVNGNLGTGTINASASAALNGTAAGTTINITGGTLALGSAGRLTGTTPTVLITNGATLTLGGNESIGTLNLTNGTVGGSGTLSVATAINAQDGTLSANIGGNAGLTKTTASTVTLSGANTFTGAVAVNGGTLAVTNGSGLADTAAVTLANTAGVVLEVDSNETIGSLAGAGATGGTVALDANTLTLNQSANTTYTGAVTGTGTLAKSGSGTLTLNRTTSIGADFDLRISAGVVDLNRGSGVAIGGILGSGNSVILDGGKLSVSASSGGNGALTLGSLDIYGNSTLLLNRIGTSATHSTTLTAPLNFSNNGVLNFAYSSLMTGGTTTLAGAANTLYSDGTIAVTNYTVTVSSAFAESGGARSLTKTGAGTLVLSGANTYSGDTVVSGGELRLSGSGRIGNSSLVTVANGATMNFTNLSDTVKGLSGDGAVALGSAILTTSNSATDTFSGTIAGTGGYVKVGGGTQALTGSASSFSGSATVGGGVLRVSTLADSGANSSIGSGSSVVLTNGGVLDYTGSTTAVNRGFALSSGNGGIGVSNAATDLTLSGAITGTGNLVKSGDGTLTLTGANTYGGATTVNAGTLELARTGGTATLPSTTSVTVASSATLLISQSNQVNNNASVTLSGGTITRGSGVSEVFGNLVVTGSGFLDYGSGDIGTLSFGTYTPSALLTVNNFLPGNTLTFASDLSDDIGNSSLFSLGAQGFTSSWNSGTSTFTITAIPEPSTYLAAAGLLSLMLWPSRKRLLKDAKKILGLTAPMRDRLAARRA
jgi:autotransporter-associated beta strand protein